MSERSDHPGLSEAEIAAGYAAELPVYEHHLRASAAFLAAFPKGTLGYALGANGLHQVDVNYGNADRQNHTLETRHKGELLAFLAGMIVMSEDSLEIPA